MDRTPLRRVLSHPFFNPTLPTDSLSGFIGSRSRYRSRPIYETSLGRHVLVPLNTSQFWPSVEPSKTISSRKTPFSTEGSKSNERDPISLNPVGGCSFITSQRLPLPVQDNTYILGSVETLKGRNLNEFNSVELESKRPASPRPTRRGVNLPRKVLSAGGLPPQTFRTTHGMIIIQLSREVVVDLREGERLKGRNGGVILVAQSDGNKVPSNFLSLSTSVTHLTRWPRLMYIQRHTSAYPVFFRNQFLLGSSTNYHLSWQDHTSLPQNTCTP